jgi:hypothetical protein
LLHVDCTIETIEHSLRFDATCEACAAAATTV